MDKGRIKEREQKRLYCRCRNLIVIAVMARYFSTYDGELGLMHAPPKVPAKPYSDSARYLSTSLEDLRIIIPDIPAKRKSRSTIPPLNK